MAIPWNDSPNDNNVSNISKMDSPLKAKADARPHTSNVEAGKSSNSEKKEGNRSEISFAPRKPIYSLSDIVLNDQVKQQVRILISRIKNHKLLYETWGLKKIDPQGTHIAVNFYGPPEPEKRCVQKAWRLN